MPETIPKVIVVGGGLAGISAAATLLEKGCGVILLEKHGRAGGASSKATCGIAAPDSDFQKNLGVEDDGAELLENAQNYTAVKQLVADGGDAVDWLIDVMNLKSQLSLLDMPGHKVKRVIGAKENFPGAVLTYKSLQMLQLVAKANPDRLNIICNAEVTKLVVEGEGSASKVAGVEFKMGKATRKMMGTVVIATGGYTGDLSSNGLLAKFLPGYSPSMANAIDSRAKGDGIDLAVAVGAGTADLDKVSYCSLAANIPGKEDKPFKMCIADTLCSFGAVIVNNKGERVVNELDHADARMEQMVKDGGSFYLALTQAVQEKPEVKFLVEFYESHSFFTMYGGPASFARSIGAEPKKIEKCLGQSKGSILASPILPCLQSSLGGITTGFDGGTEGKVLRSDGTPIEGLYAAGEVTAVPYPRVWSMTGIPLLHAVYTGKMAGDACAASLGHPERIEDVVHLTVPWDSIDHGHHDLLHHDHHHHKHWYDTDAGNADAKLEDMSKDELIARIQALEAGGAVAGAGGGDGGEAPAEDAGPPSITMADVEKHKSKDDAWIVLFGKVIDVTNWIPKHPGGEQAIMVFLGMDATEEWQNIHKPGTLENANYSKNFTIVGELGDGKPKGGGGAAPAGGGGITIDEIKKHTTKETGLWIAINGMVLDVTEFTAKHPGGEAILMANAGNDASTDWNGIHKPGTVEKWLKMEGGPKLVGNFDGAAPVALANAEPAEDWLVIEGEGRIPGLIGSAVYLVINLLRMILRTIFFTGNFKFKLDNNRKGTIQTAMMLLLFTVIHAGGNFVDMLFGPKSANGEGETLKRLAGGDFGVLLKLPFGFDLSVLEVYIIVALAIHVIVALKRSWDISINYCLYTGKWNMMLSGLFTLTFLMKHLTDIKFSLQTKEVWMRLPKYYLDLPPHIFFEEHGSDDNGLFGSVCRKVRDTYSQEIVLFKDNKTVAFYAAAILFFVYHMVRGWEKLVTAEMLQIPSGHVKRVTYLGWLLAVAVGSMYMTVLWYTYFAPADVIVDDPTCIPKA